MVKTRFRLRTTGDGISGFIGGLNRTKAKRKASVAKALGEKVEITKVSLKNGKVIKKSRIPLRNIVTKKSISDAKRRLLRKK